MSSSSAAAVPPPPPPPPPRRAALSVATRAGRAFPTHAVMQGFACHARGVEVVEATRARVRARARSKRVHDVELRAEGGRLIVACSCPSAALGVPGCKHAWATLLEIDRRGGLEELRGGHAALRVEAGTLTLTAKPTPPDAASERVPIKRPRPTPERSKANEPENVTRKKSRAAPASPPKPPPKPPSPPKAKAKAKTDPKPTRAAKRR